MSNFKKYHRWTEDECLNIAKQYSSKKEFKKEHPEAYDKARRMKWLYTYDWLENNQPIHHWTKEECKAEAMKYKTKMEFKRNCQSAYSAAVSHKWLKEFDFFISTRKPDGYWTYERCKEVALLCSTKAEFMNNYKSACHKSREKGWYNDICSHMPEYVTITPEDEYRQKYTIYVYEDLINHSAYVGLTNNIKKRHRQHKCQNKYGQFDSVGLYFNNINVEIPEPKIIYKNLEATDASIKEKEVYYQYKDNGWNMINGESSLGSLGAYRNIKWTYQRCKTEALKYEYLKDFRENSGVAHDAALVNGWLKDYTWLKRLEHPKGFWTKEECHKAAKQCESTQEFFYKFSRAYQLSKENGWFDEYTWLKVNPPKPRGYWNKQNCYNEALKYEYMKIFKKISNGAYTAALKNGWLNDYTWLKIEDEKDKRGYYSNKEKCLEEAKKYKSKREFKKNNIRAYNCALKHKWLNEWFK